MRPSRSTLSHDGGPALSLVPTTPQRESEATDRGPETKIGLYLGYDRARVALGRLASEMGRTPFEAPSLRGETGVAATEEIQRGARAAAFAAFALVCEQAEELRRELCEQWPEVRADLGGPIPVRAQDALPADHENRPDPRKNSGDAEPPPHSR